MLSFLDDKFKISDASRLEIEQLCLAVVNLFPCLRTPNSKIAGIVSSSIGSCILKYVQVYGILKPLQDELYNFAGQSGQFFVKIKNARQNINRTKPKSRAIDQEEEDLIQYFKNCVVINERDDLIKRLKDTVPLRQNIIKVTSQNIHECFSFYYADPTIVSIF